MICTCDQCGKSLWRNPCELLRSKHRFCDYKCMGAWRSEHQVGENHPRWKGGPVACICAQCGTPLKRKPSELAKSKYHFCDKECHGAWRSEHRTGENSCNWNGGLATCACAQCGALVERKPDQLARSKHHFCGTKCKGVWMSEHQTGESHPGWKGGASDERGRWEQNGSREWRRACRKRDAYACQLCGKVFDKHSKGLHVHHKAAFADYPELRSDEANGICLCERCHIGWIHTNEGRLVRLRWEQDALAENCTKRS